MYTSRPAAVRIREPARTPRRARPCRLAARPLPVLRVSGRVAAALEDRLRVPIIHAEVQPPARPQDAAQFEEPRLGQVVYMSNRDLQDTRPNDLSSNGRCGTMFTANQNGGDR